MNRKQLILILVTGAVLGAIGLMVYRRDTSSWKATGSGAGQKILGSVDINSVAQVVIKNATNEVNLLRQDETWVVRERHNYPANFTEIGEFLRKAYDLKAIQRQKVGASQLARLELVEPGKGASSGTLVDLKDKSGARVKALLLGKKHTKKPAAAAASPFGGDEGWPDGRYILALDGSTEVLLVNDALSNVEPKADQWLSKDFIKVEKIRSIEVVHPQPTNSWKLARETESGEFKLADAKPDEKPDAGKLSGMGSVLSWPSFVDVVAPDTKPQDTGLDQPVVATLETFDGFAYTVKVGKKSGEENLNLQIALNGSFPKERTPGKDEKKEDKEKLDKEFKEKLAKQEEKLKQEKAVEKWTYVVSKWTVENLLKERKDLFADKKDAAKEGAKDGGKDAALGESPKLPGADAADMTPSDDSDKDDSSDPTTDSKPDGN